MDYKLVTQRLVSGFAWQGLTKLITQVLTWASMVVVARILTPGEYGIAAVATVVTGVLITFMEMGLSSALIQKEGVTRQEEDGVFYLSLAISLALYGALFGVAPIIARFYEMPELEGILRLSGLALIAGSLRTVPMAKAMRQMDFRYRSFVEMAGNLGAALVTIILVTHGYGVWSLAWGVVATFSIMALGYLPLLERFPRPSLRHFREIGAVVHYGVHLMGGQFAYALHKQSDVFIIGKLLGGTATGFYSMAVKLADIPLDKIASIFVQVAFPALSRVKGDDSVVQRMYLQLHRYLLAIALPLLFGLAAVANDAVGVVLSEKWLPMVPVLQILCILNAVRVSGTLAMPGLNSQGRVKITLRYSLISLALLPPAYMLAAYLGNVTTVALARLVTYPLLYVGLIYFLLGELKISFKSFWHSARPPLVAATVMFMAVGALEEFAQPLDAAARLLLSIGLGALVYFATFHLLFPEEVRQVRQAWALLRGRPAAQPG
jgi:teichuronic acid exporter